MKKKIRCFNFVVVFKSNIDDTSNSQRGNLPKFPLLIPTCVKSFIYNFLF